MSNAGHNSPQCKYGHQGRFRGHLLGKRVECEGTGLGTERTAARMAWLVKSTRQPALPFFVASNRCSLKRRSQRKERRFRANARTFSRAKGRKLGHPASWDGTRLVPSFVDSVCGAEGGYWLHPTFSETLMGTSGVVLRRISKLLSSPALGFIQQASPQCHSRPYSLISGLVNASFLWGQGNGAFALWGWALTLFLWQTLRI